jgi:hypothetical protein
MCDLFGLFQCFYENNTKEIIHVSIPMMNNSQSIEWKYCESSFNINPNVDLIMRDPMV